MKHVLIDKISKLEKKHQHIKNELIKYLDEIIDIENKMKILEVEMENVETEFVKLVSELDNMEDDK